MRSKVLILVATLAVAGAVPGPGAARSDSASGRRVRGALIQASLSAARTGGSAYLSIATVNQQEVVLAGAPSRTAPEETVIQLDAAYNGGELSAEAPPAGAPFPTGPVADRMTLRFVADVVGGTCRTGRAAVRLELAVGAPVAAVEPLVMPPSPGLGGPDTMPFAIGGRARTERSLRVLGGTLESCLGTAQFAGGEGSMFESAGVRAVRTVVDPNDRESESPGRAPVGASGEAASGESASGNPASVVTIPDGAYSPSYEGSGVLPNGKRPNTGPPTVVQTSAGVGAEVIWGSDDRYQTFDATWFPARAVGRITGTWFNTSSNFACTGWLIGPNTVVTAGHCVFDYYGTGQWATSVSFSPGQTSSTTKPYGTCGTQGTLKSRTSWVNNGDYDRDIGIIELSCTIGNTTGWFGFFWTSSDLEGLPTWIRGYPGDKPTGTMWRSVDYVRDETSYRVYYKNDTTQGMSGSPVYYNRNGCGKCSMGPHSGSNPNYNRGTRITQSLFDWMLYWKNNN